MPYDRSSNYASREFKTSQGTYQCGSEVCVWVSVCSGLGPRGRLTITLWGKKRKTALSRVGTEETWEKRDI